MLAVRAAADALLCAAADGTRPAVVLAHVIERVSPMLGVSWIWQKSAGVIYAVGVKGWICLALFLLEGQSMRDVLSLSVPPRRRCCA